MPMYLGAKDSPALERWASGTAWELNPAGTKEPFCRPGGTWSFLLREP